MNNPDAWLSDNNSFLPGRLLLGNQPVLKQNGRNKFNGKIRDFRRKNKTPGRFDHAEIRGLLILVLFCQSKFKTRQ